MKRLFIILIFLFLGAFISAQTTTNTLSLSGSVPQVLNIALSASTSTFDLNELGATVTLPSVIFKSNLKSWAIKVYSLNASNLKNNDNDLIPYTFTLGSLFSGITLLSTEPTSLETGYKLMSGKTAKLGDTYTMSITYNSDGGTFWSYDAGAFTDTITLKVAVN